VFIGIYLDANLKTKSPPVLYFFKIKADSTRTNILFAAAACPGGGLLSPRKPVSVYQPK
jgi:hypothetical protein